MITQVLHLAQRLPKLSIQAAVQPVTSRILRVSLTVSGDFEWQDKWHGQSEPWWIWVEDSNSEVYFSISI
jgi:Sec63 Brl domain